MRERGGRGDTGSSPSRSFPSFLHQQHTPASTDAPRCSEPLSYHLLPQRFPPLPAKPSRHADPTGILNARREADCLTAYAKPRLLDGGMAARSAHGSEEACASRQMLLANLAATCYASASYFQLMTRFR